MPNQIQQQIAQQRQAIARQRQEIARTRMPQLSREQLQRQTLQQATQRKAQIQKAKQKATRQLSSQERAFEIQVARARPGLAKPQFLEPEYQKAKESISKQISRLDVLIGTTQAKIKAVRLRPRTERTEETIDNLSAALNEYRAEKGGWSSGLAGSKADVVKKHLSGYTKQFAGFEGRKVYVQQQRAEARREFKIERMRLAPDIKVGMAELSFAESPQEYAKIYRDLPAAVQKHIISPARVDFKITAPRVEEFVGQKYLPGYAPTGSAAWDAAYITPEYAKWKIEKPKVPLTPTESRTLSFQAERIRAEEGFYPTVIQPAWEGFTGAAIGVGATIGAAPVQLVPRVLEPLPLFEPVRDVRIGQVVRGVRETIPYVAGIAATEWERKLEEGEIPLEVTMPGFEVPLYQKVTMVGEPGEFVPPSKIEVPEYGVTTAAGLIPKVVRYGPEVVAYTLATIPMLTVDVITGAEKMRTLDEDVEKELKKMYEEHLKEELEEGEAHLTLGEFTKGYKWEVKEQMKKQIELEAGVSAAILLTLGTAKVIKALKTPIVTKVPTRKLKTPFFKEEAITIVGEKGPIRVAKYKVVGEVKPPIKVIETTRFRELFKMKPKREYILPPKKFVQITPYPVVGEKPFLVGEIRAGQRYGTFYRLEGVSIPTDLQTLKGMTKVRQFEWQRLAEEITGRPVSLKNVPKILSKNAQKVESYIESRRLFRVQPPKKEILRLTTPWKPGKAITRAEAVSEIKLIKETEELRVLGIKTIFKDITFPGARAIGKTPKLKGVIMELKEPIYLDVGKGVTYIQPAAITKTPFTKTFQIQKTKLLPKPPLPEIKPTVPTKVVLKPEVIGKELPLMVGGLGLKEVPYAGMGLYERMEGVSVIGIPLDRVEVPSAVIPIIIPKEVVKVIPKEVPLVIPRVVPKEVPLVIPRVVPKEITMVVPRVIPRLITEVVPKVIPKVVTRVVPRVIPRLITEVVPRVTPIVITVPRVTPRPTPKVPITKIRIRKPLKRLKRFPPRKKPLPEVGYGFEIRRKGKWVRIHLPFAFATEEGAHAVAMEKVRREAAASYRLVKSLKPIKRTRKRPSPLHKVMFRPGKEKGVMVQKKLLRITTPGEVREISLVGAAARRGVQDWGLKSKKVTKKKKSVKKKSKGRKK